MTRLLLAAALPAAAGCVPKGGPLAPAAAPEKGAASPDGPPAAVPPADVFRPPAPAGAADDPRVAEALAGGDAISKSLAVVHHRLTTLRAAYETKARTETDLKQAAERLGPLLSAARADCDAVLRAARDLRAELPLAKDGYAAAAARYRERAGRYRDPELAAVTRKLAAEFDRLAADTPRRVALTEAFIARLGETSEFLAEADRCLRDTATALAVLSAGPDGPRPSPEGRAFRRRLEEFIAVVAEYQEAFFPRPDPAPAPRPVPPPAKPPALPPAGKAEAPRPPGPPKPVAFETLPLNGRYAPPRPPPGPPKPPVFEPLPLNGRPPAPRVYPVVRR